MVGLTPPHRPVVFCCKIRESDEILLTLHKVPASSPKFLEKSRGLTVDNITYDLEDSVTPAKKPEARTNLRNFLEQPRVKGVKEVAVRINSVDTPYAQDDLQEVVRLPQHLETKQKLQEMIDAISLIRIAQSPQSRCDSDSQSQLRFGSLFCHRRRTTLSSDTAP